MIVARALAPAHAGAVLAFTRALVALALVCPGRVALLGLRKPTERARVAAPRRMSANEAIRAQHVALTLLRRMRVAVALLAHAAAPVFEMAHGVARGAQVQLTATLLGVAHIVVAETVCAARFAPVTRTMLLVVSSGLAHGALQQLEAPHASVFVVRRVAAFVAHPAKAAAAVAVCLHQLVTPFLRAKTTVRTLGIAAILDFLDHNGSSGRWCGLHLLAQAGKRAAGRSRHHHCLHCFFFLGNRLRSRLFLAHFRKKAPCTKPVIKTPAKQTHSRQSQFIVSPSIQTGQPSHARIPRRTVPCTRESRPSPTCQFLPLVSSA